MHEQIHAENKPTTEPPAADAGNTIERVSEPMRRFALENPTLTHEENKRAVMSGKFSQVLRVGSQLSIYVILTISPDDTEKGEPFWHCSMSLCSSSSGRAKTVGLWTTREMKNVRRLLPLFLGIAGRIETQDFMRTVTALHCHRNLTAFELEQINWRKK